MRKQFFAALAGVLVSFGALAAQQTINVGTTANDGTGDTLRTAGGKMNSNFTELYTTLQPILVGDVATVGASNSTTIAPGSVSLSKMATVPAWSIIGNATSTAGVTPATIGPPDLVVMNSPVIVVNIASTANFDITTGGTATTVDSVTPTIGTLVLLKNQTTSSQNGIYVVQSGTWTRSPILPAGYALPAQCNVVVSVISGTINAGYRYKLLNSSVVTIGTNNQIWSAVNGNALVKDTSGNYTISSKSTFNGVGINIAISSNPAISAATPSTTGITLSAYSGDNKGTISGLSSHTSVTLTFASAVLFTEAPSCLAVGDAAAISGLYVSSTATTVTFNFAAYSGAIHYHCF